MIPVAPLQLCLQNRQKMLTTISPGYAERQNSSLTVPLRAEFPLWISGNRSS
jgi:hypothetical protein